MGRLGPDPMSLVLASCLYPSTRAADRVHMARSPRYWNSENEVVDRRIQLRPFRLPGVVQAREEKRNGRLERVEKS